VRSFLPRVPDSGSPRRIKPPRGFVLVQINQCYVQWLRALADCHGAGFSRVAARALMEKINALELELGISASQAARMSKRQRRAFRESARHLRKRLEIGCGLPLVGN